MERIAIAVVLTERDKKKALSLMLVLKYRIKEKVFLKDG